MANRQMNSKTNNNTNKAKQVKPTPFCKVCQDAGKPESEFRSHFTRATQDRNSKVTCPLLLSLECRICFKSGNTQKYCKVTVRSDKPTSKPEAEPKRQKINVFDYFDDMDTDSDNDDKEVPEISGSLILKRERERTMASYAQALQGEAATAPKPVTLPIMQQRSWIEMDADSSDGEDTEPVLPRPALIRNNRF